ncbi:hypothetical protein HQO44_17140 [Rhodococcus fascians]|uniref:hypothetical protein n=1 Tax=Rhodococcus sp. 06-1474-1B TaxID=2022499 RepID=UPI000B9B63AF|nr:hypothetical protein [Rhodococcus sp. 06-1474-1B]MBY4208185.1 hypothetical protein [Rhodococcus fascians]OZD39367.1 hypothetical protein CH252_30730 [Rhodococcus sp. 06-1477-1B]OZD53779.1 hypothetical protein CH266_04370 [Rhodococcus sp. 06-1474-1B]
MTPPPSGGVPGSDESILLLPPDQSEVWAQNSYLVRACELVLTRTVDPVPNSALDRVDAIYHWEKVSVWTRNYLLAAAENLSLWADLVAPYEFMPGAMNRVRMRPYLLLARSGLEAAAHALWILDLNSFEECVQRHVRLMHHDFTMHKKALVARESDPSRIERRITALKSRAATLPFPTALTDKPPGYEKLVRGAAESTGSDPNEWAYLWNAASGAGHGQNWFGLEGFDLIPSEEYEPGHFRTASIPDPTYITQTIDAAAQALFRGTLRWLELGGHDLNMIRSAMTEVHAKMPKKSDESYARRTPPPEPPAN